MASLPERAVGAYIADSYVFKQPVFNYSAGFPILKEIDAANGAVQVASSAIISPRLQPSVC